MSPCWTKFTYETLLREAMKLINNYNCDGIDFNHEHMLYKSKPPSEARIKQEYKLIFDVSATLKKRNIIVTHAPVASHLAASKKYPNASWKQSVKASGKSISQLADCVFVQFYNGFAGQNVYSPRDVKGALNTLAQMKDPGHYCVGIEWKKFKGQCPKILAELDKQKANCVMLWEVQDGKSCAAEMPRLKFR